MDEKKLPEKIVVQRCVDIILGIYNVMDISQEDVGDLITRILKGVENLDDGQRKVSLTLRSGKKLIIEISTINEILKDVELEEGKKK